MQTIDFLNKCKEQGLQKVDMQRIKATKPTKVQLKKIEALSEEIKIGRMTWFYVEVNAAIIAIKPKQTRKKKK